MSDYNHRMTLVVPELMIPQANQLALIVGESADDVNTFIQTSYQDKEGNKYAVCSTVIKPIVLSLLDTPLADSPLKAEEADLVLAQQALDKVVMYKQGDKVSTTSIMCAIDFEPLTAFEDMGLTIIEVEL